MNEADDAAKLAAGRAWFDFYTHRASNGVHTERSAHLRQICPCCGYATLPQRGRYDVCELCNWEDDGQDDPYADEVWGGPNSHYSLMQARENFKRHWIMYDPDDSDRRHLFNSSVEMEAKKAIVAAFEAMKNADETEQALLWNEVRKGEAILSRELSRSIAEDEARIEASKRMERN